MRGRVLSAPSSPPALTLAGPWGKAGGTGGGTAMKTAGMKAGGEGEKRDEGEEMNACEIAGAAGAVVRTRASSERLLGDEDMHDVLNGVVVGGEGGGRSGTGGEGGGNEEEEEGEDEGEDEEGGVGGDRRVSMVELIPPMLGIGSLRRRHGGGRHGGASGGRAGGGRHVRSSSTRW